MGIDLTKLKEAAKNLDTAHKLTTAVLPDDVDHQIKGERLPFYLNRLFAEAFLTVETRLGIDDEMSKNQLRKYSPSVRATDAYYKALDTIGEKVLAEQSVGKITGDVAERITDMLRSEAVRARELIELVKSATR